MNADASPRLNRIDQSLLRRAQWRAMTHALQWSLAANVVAGAILAAALAWSFEIYDGVYWFTGLTALTIVRAAVLWRYGRAAVVGRAPKFARTLLLIGVAASGVVWGLTALCLTPSDAFAVQVLLCFFAAGMSAGAASSINVVRFGFELFAAPMLFMLAVGLASVQAGPSAFMTVAIVVFGVIMFGVAATGRAQVEQAYALWLANRRLHLDLVEARRREIEAEELAQSLSHKTAEAEAAVQSSTMALAAVSHEIRTPLNAMIGFSEMIAEEHYGKIGDERYREYAQDILQSGVHLRTLIDDLLHLSSRRGGRGELDVEELLVADVCGEVAKEFAMSNPSAAARLVVDVSPAGLSLVADRRLLYQIVRNLCENAVKFADPDTEIRVEGRETLTDEVRISVKDRGAGIPKDKLDAVLKPFAQAGGGDSARRDGVGLGLALVKEFADAHGGRIEITSQEGVGVTIDVTLPKQPPS